MNTIENELMEFDKVWNKYDLGRDVFTGQIISREYRMQFEIQGYGKENNR